MTQVLDESHCCTQLLLHSAAAALSCCTLLCHSAAALCCCTLLCHSAASPCLPHSAALLFCLCPSLDVSAAALLLPTDDTAPKQPNNTKLVTSSRYATTPCTLHRLTLFSPRTAELSITGGEVSAPVCRGRLALACHDASSPTGSVQVNHAG